MRESIVRDKLTKINEVLGQDTCRDHGFAGGTLGLSYYYFHAARALQQEAFGQKGETLLETLFDDMNAGGKGMWGAFLSNGGAGLGYVMNYLQQNGFVEFD